MPFGGHEPYMTSIDDYFGDKWNRGPIGGSGGPAGPGPGGGGEALGFFGAPGVTAERNPYVRRRIQPMGGGMASRQMQRPAEGPMSSGPMLGGMRRVMGQGGAPGAPGTIPGTSGWTEREGMRDSDVSLESLIGPNGGISMPQFLQGLTASGVRGGIFDPMGSKELTEMLMGSARREFEPRERSARLAAELSAGDDPYLRAFAGTQSRNQSASDLARLLGDTQAQSALQNQRFLQSIFGGPVAGAATRKDAPAGNPWAQVGGQLGGGIIGSFLGGG